MKQFIFSYPKYWNRLLCQDGITKSCLFIILGYQSKESIKTLPVVIYIWSGKIYMIIFALSLVALTSVPISALILDHWKARYYSEYIVYEFIPSYSTQGHIFWWPLRPTPLIFGSPTYHWFYCWDTNGEGLTWLVIRSTRMILIM